MKICPFYNLYTRQCSLGKDECIGDEYQPETCDVLLEEKILVIQVRKESHEN